MSLVGKLRRIASFTILMWSLGSFCSAQSNLAIYHQKFAYNSAEVNPAFLASKEKFIFSIFPLAGLTVGYNNQLEIRKTMFELTNKKITEIDFEDFLIKMIRHGQFTQKFDVPLLIFGYTNSYGAFTFRIQETEQISMNLNGPFSEFLTNPLSQTYYFNQSQIFPIKALYYREYSVGCSKEIIRKKLIVGFRTKLLFGKATLNSNVRAGISPRNGDLIMETSGAAKLSFPVELVQNTDHTLSYGTIPDGFKITDYLFSSKNMGMAVDLGFNFKISPKLEFSASVIDLGQINWNNYITNLNFNGDITLLNQYITSQGSDFVTKNPNFIAGQGRVSIYNLFKIIPDQIPFSTTLPTSFHAGIKYNLNHSTNLGLVSRYIKSKGLNHSSHSLTLNYQVNEKLAVTSGYSIIGNNYLNVPFILVYNRKTSQSFIGTDNLISFVLPKATDISGITFGTYFYVFKYKSKYKNQRNFQPYFKEKKPRIRTPKGLIFNQYRNK